MLPVIQPNAASGGASLAPDAGGAGGSTINPTESRVQQQAAAAVAAQQAAVAYEKRGRDVREYTDALVEYHDLPGEFRSTEAPKTEMMARRGAEITNPKTDERKADLSAAARAQEIKHFEDWERGTLFEGDKLNRARDYQWNRLQRESAQTTGYFDVGRGMTERELIDVQNAYNLAKKEGKEFTYEPKLTAEEALRRETMYLGNRQADFDMRENTRKNILNTESGILVDPTSAQSLKKLEAKYQQYQKFLETPLNFENRVYYPSVAPERMAADSAAMSSRIAATDAANASLAGRMAMAEGMGVTLDQLGRIDAEYRQRAAAERPFSPQQIDLSGMDAGQKHDVMTSLGFRSFDQLDTYVKGLNADILAAPQRAAEKAAWTTYQNRTGVEQTNPVLKEYAKAQEIEQGMIRSMGTPTGLSRMPQLTEGEKESKMRKLWPERYWADPVSGEIKQKEIVDTSDFISTQLMPGAMAIREWLGSADLDKARAEVEAGKKINGKEGYYIQDALLNFNQWGMDLPINALYSLRNVESTLHRPPQETLDAGKIGYGAITSAEGLVEQAKTNPAGLVGTLAGGAVLGYLGGAGVASVISRAGTAAKTSSLYKTLGTTGGDIKTVKAITTVGKNVQKIEPEMVIEPQLSTVRNIGPEAPKVLNALRNEDVTIYGTAVNTGQKAKPPRTTSDIDIFIQADDTARISALVDNLGKEFHQQNIAIVRDVAPGKTAHAIDTHLYPSDYPALHPVVTKGQNSYAANEYFFPFSVVPTNPSQIVAAAGIRMESDAVQGARKAAATLYHEGDDGKIIFGPAEHRAKDAWDFFTDTQYKIDVERGRTRNPLRLYRTNQLENALSTASKNPKLRNMAAEAEENLLGSGQIESPNLLSYQNSLTYQKTSLLQALRDIGTHQEYRYRYLLAGGDPRTYDAIVDIAKRGGAIEPEILQPINLAKITNIGEKAAPKVTEALRNTQTVVYGQGSLGAFMKTPYRATSDIDVLTTEHGVNALKTANKEGKFFSEDDWVFNTRGVADPDAAIDAHPFPGGYPGIRKTGKTDPYPLKTNPFDKTPKKGEIVTVDGINIEKPGVQLRRKAEASLYHIDYGDDNKFVVGPKSHRGGKDPFDLVALANYQAKVEQGRLADLAPSQRLRRQRNINALAKDIRTVLNDPIYKPIIEQAEKNYMDAGSITKPVLRSDDIVRPTNSASMVRSLLSASDEGVLDFGSLAGMVSRPKPRHTIHAAKRGEKERQRSSAPGIKIYAQGYRTYTDPLTKGQKRTIRRSTAALAITPRSQIPHIYAPSSPNTLPYTVPYTPHHQPPYNPPHVPPTPPINPPTYIPPIPPINPPYTPPPIPPIDPPTYIPPPIPPIDPPTYIPPIPPIDPPTYIPPPPPPYTHKPIPIIGPPRRRKRDRDETDHFSFRPVRTERLDHITMVDPLESLGTGKSMTNRKKRSQQPKDTFYEYGGAFHLNPPKTSPKTKKHSLKKSTKITRRKR